MSIPRAELLAYQLLALGIQYVLLNLCTEIKRVVAFTDSQIVIQQMKKAASSLDIFTGTRIDLIKSIFEQYNVEARHVKGLENPADMCTKVCKADQMKGDLWQRTTFLHKPEGEWPVYEAKIKLLKLKPTQENKIKLEEVLDADKYRSLKKCRGILSCILKWKYKTEDEESRLRRADRILELDAAQNHRKHFKKVFTQHRTVEDEDGRVFLINRGTEKEQPKRILLVDKNSMLGKLIILQKHDDNHGYGARFIAAKVREKYYIPHLTAKLAEVSRHCYKCKLLHLQEVQQLMAPQKQLRLEMVPPFTNIMLDYCGPARCIDEVKRRTTMKVYFMLVSCLNTRALNVVVCRDLTTDTFVLALRQHIAIRGAPKVCYSDLGTNFVGGRRMMVGDEAVKINTDALDSMAKTQEFKFIFGTPEHHEGQGAVEKMVHLFKLALKRNNDGQIPTMTFSEWTTTAAEMTALVNSRPLVLEPGSGEALTPGEVLTLRPVSSPLGSTGVQDTALTRRANKQRDFLLAWYEKYFAAMKTRILGFQNKWKKKMPNLRKEDVVLILDKPNLKLNKPFTLARVIEAEEDVDKVVRKVLVQYIGGQEGAANRRLKRHVNSLCLLTRGTEIKIPGVDDVGGDQEDHDVEDGEEDHGVEDDQDDNDGGDDLDGKEDKNNPGQPRPVKVQYVMDTPMMKDLAKRRGKKKPK